VLFQKRPVVLIRDEADFLALRPIIPLHPSVCCQLFYFAFQIISQWKECARQLLLAESIEEVRLVFAPISSTKKTQTPIRFITKQSDIMAGCEGGCSQFNSFFLEQGELDAWIADYAGVRGLTPAVRLQKWSDYLLAEGAAKIHHVEGNI
jgi:hypothetical protein